MTAHLYSLRVCFLVELALCFPKSTTVLIGEEDGSESSHTLTVTNHSHFTATKLPSSQKIWTLVKTLSLRSAENSPLSGQCNHTSNSSENKRKENYVKGIPSASMDGESPLIALSRSPIVDTSAALIMIRQCGQVANKVATCLPYYEEINANCTRINQFGPKDRMKLLSYKWVYICEDEESGSNGYPRLEEDKSVNDSWENVDPPRIC